MNVTATGSLYVDLDGTLTRSDVLIESVFMLMRSEPLALLRFPAWWLRGRAHFKREVARRVDIDVAKLPWTSDFLDYLRTCRDEGRRLVLITASDQKYADAAADHLGLGPRPGPTLDGLVDQVLVPPPQRLGRHAWIGP